MALVDSGQLEKGAVCLGSALERGLEEPMASEAQGILVRAIPAAEPD